VKVYAVEFVYVDTAGHSSAPLFFDESGCPTPDQPGLWWNVEDAQAFMRKMLTRRGLHVRLVSFTLRRQTAYPSERGA